MGSLRYECSFCGSKGEIEDKKIRRDDTTTIKLSSSSSYTHDRIKFYKFGQTYTCPVTGMEFVFVKGGKYLMGDIWGLGTDDEKPAHEVELDDFYMGKYPVTQGQWKKVMGNNPSSKDCGDNCPVENVSWNNAQEFINKLNSMTDGKYRLPFEAEWEYAASWAGEGKKNKWAGTDKVNKIKDYAWYFENSDMKTHPVGKKNSNTLGLHDMTGNVWEWCMDWYDSNYYEKSPKKNPTGPLHGDYRVLMGGSYQDFPGQLRVSHRIGLFKPNYCNSRTGLRFVMML